MDSNAAIVKFNTEQISVNSSLLNGNLMPSKATPQSNAKTIENNKKAMKDLEGRISKNRSKMEALISNSKKNSQALIANKKQISDRRESIMKNRSSILSNKSKIFG